MADKVATLSRREGKGVKDADAGKAKMPEEAAPEVGHVKQKVVEQPRKRKTPEGNADKDVCLVDLSQAQRHKPGAGKNMETLTHAFSPQPSPQFLPGGTSTSAPITIVPATSPPSIVDLVQAYRITDGACFADALAAISYLSTLAQSACGCSISGGGKDVQSLEQELQEVRDQLKKKERELNKDKEMKKKADSRITELRADLVVVQNASKTENEAIKSAEDKAKSAEEKARSAEDKVKQLEDQVKLSEDRVTSMQKEVDGQKQSFEDFKKKAKDRANELEEEVAVSFRDGYNECLLHLSIKDPGFDTTDMDWTTTVRDGKLIPDKS